MTLLYIVTQGLVRQSRLSCLSLIAGRAQPVPGTGNYSLSG
jgi:hypothetical protein